MNINTSLSGIRNAFERQDVTANNIANINTKNYKARDVLNKEVKNGGVEAAIKKSTETPNKNGNNVNLTREIVNQINNINQEKTNINVLKSQNEMFGSLIDIKA